MAKKEKVQEINPVCPITESENGNINRSFYDMDRTEVRFVESSVVYGYR